ncbi:FAD/NAD(P)-binding protein [candidate division KSB1 bacterium]|nr:FAD/NAD(P)-binding protein [candidate division KSB1 bacterium]
MDNLYLPRVATIDKIVDETDDTKTYTVHFTDAAYQAQFSFQPGQFLQVTAFGAGECPIGFASSPFRKGDFDITIRDVGRVTHVIHQLKVGDTLGLRGPFGNHFPFEEVKGLNVLFVAGGIGLPPLRTIIDPMLEHRAEFKRFILLYGARTPKDRVYKSTLDGWANRADLEFFETVDVGDDAWRAQGKPEGVVTRLFGKVKVDPQTTVAFTCGPPIMIRFVIQELLMLGIPEARIITTLERYMKCGVGKCGHCAIGHKYICVDGPVFTYKQIKLLPER